MRFCLGGRRIVSNQSIFHHSLFLFFHFRSQNPFLPNPNFANGQKSNVRSFQDLQSALRRAGQNPTESEVQDMINKIDDGSASLDFPDFCLLIGEKAKELDPETHFKDTFRVFSKDEEGKE